MDTVLVIDDQPDNVKLLLDFLSKKGFKMLVAHDGKEGIRMAELTQPDLILLDVTMPEMDGFEVCQALKNHEKTQGIPVIFMTARTEIVDKLKGFEVGAADYITKPFQFEEVLARVTSHLKLRKLQTQLLQKNQQLQEEITHRKQVEMSLETEKKALVERTTELKVVNAQLARAVKLKDELVERTTELKVVNAQLARAVKLKDEFLANVSHELRTPLHTILTIAEGLQEEAYGPLNQQQCRYLRTQEESGRHLLSLINDILDLSKIEVDKLSLELDIVSVNEVCQASLRLIKEQALKKRIKISAHLDPTVEMIQADQRRMKQILVNLLGNAVKFTPEGGSITLEVNGDAKQGVAQFSVQDTGIGIAKEELENIFKAFVQLDGGLNRAQKGTGLGLSLAYHLTELHNGHISVESEVGKGSRFTVSLPWQPKRPDNSPDSDITHQPRTVREQENIIGRCDSSSVILLADDQETSVEILSNLLRSQGYQTLIAHNGAEAVKQARAKSPDLILMDIQMPVMSGLEAIKAIRAAPDIATTPIIALTALAMPDDKKRCLSAGATDYLSKPVNLKKLVTAIEALL
jgi:signal transduction histidine kinase